MVDAAVKDSIFQHCCFSRNCFCIFTSKTYTSALHLAWSCTDRESGNGLDGYILGDTDRTLPSGKMGSVWETLMIVMRAKAILRMSFLIMH